MSFKKVIALCLALVMLAGITACSSDDTGSGASQISIYVLEYDTNTKNAIKKFNSEHKDVQIKEKVFFNDQVKEFEDTLKSEIATGGGPDVIVANTFSIPNLSQYMDRGAFCDLKGLIDNDKSFKMSEYNEKVLSYGEYKGKRYLIPLFYNLSALFTTKDQMENNNVTLDISKLSLDELITSARELMKVNSDKEKYFLNEIDIKPLLQSLDTPIIDYEKKEAAVDTTELAMLMEKYKGLYPAFVPADHMAKEYSISSISDILVNDKAVMAGGMVTGPKNLWQNYSSFKSEVDPVLYPIPSLDGKKHVTADISVVAAINEKCKNKKAAFDFIKLMLSNEFQGNDFASGIPVNKEAYEKLKKECIDGPSGDNMSFNPGRGGGCKTDVTIKKLIEQLDALVDGMQESRYIDNEAFNIIREELQKFIKENIKASEAVDRIRERINSYLKSELKTEINEEAKNKVKAAEGTKASSSLKLYYVDFQMFVTNTVREFNEKYPDVYIDAKSFSFSQYEEYRNTLATEVMAGEGPDVVIFKPDFFNSLRKTLSSGAFCDMNELIKGDKGFNLSDYNEKVLNAGNIEGKRYFIPLRYDIDMFATSKKILEKNNIKIEEGNWTWNTLGEYVRQFLKKNPTKKFFDSNFSFKNILKNCEIELVDYKNKKSYFSSKEFIGLLKVYKDIEKAIGTDEDYQKYSTPAGLLGNNAAVMITERGLGSPERLMSSNSLYKSVLGEDMELLAMPTCTGVKSVTPEISDLVAINSKCKDKKSAFEFVKLLLSKDLQKTLDSHGNPNITIGYPVNLKAYIEDAEYYSSDKAKGMEYNYGSGSFKSIPLTKNLTDRISSLVERAEIRMAHDSQIGKIVNETLNDYLAVKKTAEQAAREMDDKVMLFLNE
ncbi:MAG: extracellular solute-binding protein [Clostridia bacterium]|nr:extracellular solute-binding protein [Clostridia bacterium]